MYKQKKTLKESSRGVDVKTICSDVVAKGFQTPVILIRLPSEKYFFLDMEKMDL